jgi:hypothetical protein
MHKKNSRTDPQQGEFAFALDPSIHWVPTLDERTLCCDPIPEQRSQPLGHCFADEPNCKRLTPGGWPRLDFRPVISNRKSAGTPESQTASNAGGSGADGLLNQKVQKSDGNTRNIT